MTQFFWVGGSGNFSDATNHWATVTGGSPGAGNKPVAGDTATLDINSGGGTCTYDEAVACQDWEHKTGNVTRTDTAGFSLTLTGFFDLVTERFTASSSLIRVGTDCTISNTDGLFVRNTSTVELTGTGNLANRHANNIFNIVKVAASGQTTTLSERTATGKIEYGSGTFDHNDLNLDVGRVAFNGDKIITVDASTTITTSTSAGITIDLRTTSTTMDGFTTTNVALGFTTDGSTADIAVVTRGISVSSFGLGGSAQDVMFDLNDQDLTTVTIMTIGQTTSFPTFKCGTGTITTGGNIQMLGTGAGTFDLEGATIKCGGNWNIANANATVIEGTSTVIFEGAALQTITSGAQSFNNLSVTNVSAAGVSYLDALDVNGSLTANAASASIKMTWAITVTHNVDLFVFTGSSTNQVTFVSATPTTQYNIVLGQISNVNHVNITDCNLTGNIAHAFDENSTDGGNNNLSPPVGWQFVTILSKVVTRGVQRGILRGVT